jgi:hypothetical protein
MCVPFGYTPVTTLCVPFGYIRATGRTPPVCVPFGYGVCPFWLRDSVFCDPVGEGCRRTVRHPIFRSPWSPLSRHTGIRSGDSVRRRRARQRQGSPRPFCGQNHSAQARRTIGTRGARNLCPALLRPCDKNGRTCRCSGNRSAGSCAGRCRPTAHHRSWRAKHETPAAPWSPGRTAGVDSGVVSSLSCHRPSLRVGDVA